MRGAFAAPIQLTGRHQRRFLKPNMSGLKLKGGHWDEMVRFERSADIANSLLSELSGSSSRD